MEENFNSMNNNINVFFSRIVRDINGQLFQKEFKVISKPTETVKSLINLFFKSTNLSLHSFKFRFSGKNLLNFEEVKLEQIGIINNSKIEVIYIQMEDGPPVEYEIEDINSILSTDINRKNINYKPINNTNVMEKINKIDNDFSIKFIKFKGDSYYNCNVELKGILKLCLLSEIASRIKEPEINNLFITKKIPEMLYYILKILKNCDIYVNEESGTGKVIKKIIGSEKQCNIINFYNFVEEQVNQDYLKQLMNFLPQKELNEINEINFHLGKYYNYMCFFEKELTKSLRNSIFEFSPVSLIVLDREDFDNFQKGKANCPNLCMKLLYHRLQENPITCNLKDILISKETSGNSHGNGVYLTDSLDYCFFYGSSTNHNYNINRIPLVGDIFTSICSLVYFDKKEIFQIKVNKALIQPRKNGINFAYVDSTSKINDIPDLKKFVGTEFIINEFNQICPIISVKFKREEFCVIWRDESFSETIIHNNQFDEKFKNYLKERIRYIRQMVKYNVYTFNDTSEALKCVNRKKYNKIILISNAGLNLEGKNFVDEARKIIGNDVIVLFLSYSSAHLKWITRYKNALFSNNAKFYEEYLDSFDDIDKMKGLITKLEKYYNVKFNFDNNFLTFPLYKNKGYYSELSF